MPEQPDYTTNPSQNNSVEFEHLYQALRQAEGRVYTDAEVARLPQISGSHPFSSEWKWRRRSSKRLIRYLKRKKMPLNILEVGCGNGWLSARLAGIRNARVTGIDVIPAEIEQAQRVFKKDNLEFKQGSIDNTLMENEFDIIVFAASLPYFPKAKNVLKHCVSLLKKSGEIHVIDTPFYHDRKVVAQVLRSREHFEGLKLPDMAKYYHHYSLDVFRELKYRIKLDPRQFIHRLKKEPFYWIKITK